MQHAKPMSNSVVQRWKDAGAEFGWADQWGYFSNSQFENDDLPAFLFESGNWSSEKLRELPDADVPFGLQLPNETADSDLQPLAALKSLKSLTLGLTRITDHGVKELVTLSTLRTLHLAGCAVGDESLNHLSKLDSLEVINLGFTQVTDAGLMHLGTL